jgi:hypothetical protein
MWKYPMGSNAARPVLLSVFGLALGLAISACTSDAQKEPDPNIFPANYKQEILDTMPDVLPDSSNIRDAFLSEPALTPGSRDQRYTVCVRFNARNESRQYVGRQDRIGYFFAGHLNQLIEPDKGQCANAAYKPFPELEKLCYAKKCN